MKIAAIKYVALAAISSLVFVGCSPEAKQTLDSKNWELTWSDEFNGTAGTLPDASKWNFDIGNNGWGNKELQAYTNSAQNVSMDGNGNLVITAKKENVNGAQYTSARINTKNLFSQAYGKFEARLIAPYGQGLWPAFWLLGSNIDTANWPQCGEIDIFEMRGAKPSINNGSMHGPGFSGGNALTNSYALFNSRFDVDYHTFAIEWDVNSVDYFVDGYLYQHIEKSSVPQWVYDHPFYMILNVAVGGNYGGNPITGTPFPQTMTIDYVRVYKQVN